MGTLLDDGIEVNECSIAPTSTRFQRYRLNILELSEGRMGRLLNALLFHLRESGVELILTGCARCTLSAWEPLSDKILTVRFRSRTRKEEG